MNNKANLINIIDDFAGRKLLVIGEAMLDSYLEGTSDRLSREAPVPIVAVTEAIHVPGGAANTAVNLRSLDTEVTLLSVIGDDPEAAKLLDALRRLDVSTEHVIKTSTRSTLSKQRIFAASQMLVRLDQGSVSPLDEETESELIRRLGVLFPACDTLLISDYNYGILTPRLISALEDLQRENPRLIVVDSKRPQDYRNLHVTAVKPNYEETIHLLGLEKAQTDEERLEQIQERGREILDLAGAQIAAVTLDHVGALIFHREDERPYRTYANPQPNSRAAGAGDTFASVLAASLTVGAHVEQAAELAAAAASIVVLKSGTANCFAEELKDYFTTHEKCVEDVFQLAMRVSIYRRAGRKIVFTNGCFDILHRGHITYLNHAKAFGDILIIGLNSDESVRRLKGAERPINSLEDRAQVLAALSSVDHIIVFEEDTPVELIRAIRPDVYIKGGDYTFETLPEAKLVAELGGESYILPYLDNHSTTGVIKKIRNKLPESVEGADELSEIGKQGTR